MIRAQRSYTPTEVAHLSRLVDETPYNLRAAIKAAVAQNNFPGRTAAAVYYFARTHFFRPPSSPNPEPESQPQPFVAPPGIFARPSWFDPDDAKLLARRAVAGR